ncbi:MAG: GtrA family protein [Alicyclobacillaceae bacterium]|nr:GtrA family protein [Alicyclobacillaceae bacterium]
MEQWPNATPPDERAEQDGGVKRRLNGVPETARQSLRFGLVGMLNTLIDFGVFSGLVQFGHWRAVPAQMVSYACGVCNSYLWNRRLTFQRRGPSRPAEVGRFAALNLLTAGLSALVIAALRSAVTPLPAAKLVATCIATAVNFAGSKWWVFRTGPPRRA